MKTIKFSHNWNNKLDCDIFTTIRRFTEEKYLYYSQSLGECFNVVLTDLDNTDKELVYTKAKLVSVMEEDLREIPLGILILDTGSFEPFKIFEQFKLTPNSKVLQLVFQK